MKITYDSDADVLEMVLRDEMPVDSDDIAPGITALKNSQGELVSLEILDASERIDGDPATVSLQLLAEPAPAAS